jgi:hypothetical protein
MTLVAELRSLDLSSQQRNRNRSSSFRPEDCLTVRIQGLRQHSSKGISTIDQPIAEPGSAAEQTISELRALSAAVELASAYARIAQLTGVAETARHNYEKAQLAYESACEALSAASGVPADFAARLSEIAAELELLERRVG